jgi:hypothetical protein
MLKQALRLISAIVVITLVSFTVSAQRYPIRLDRSEKAGERYHLLATSTEKTTANVTLSDQFLKKDEDVVAVELSADVTILEAGSNNWATRKRFTVLSSKLTRPGSTGSILPNGTEVIASIQNGQTAYEVTKSQLTKKSQKPSDQSLVCI